MASKLTCSTNSRFSVHSVISSSFFWPYPQGQAESFKLSGVLAQSGSSTYDVSHTSPVHSTDNFTRVTASLDDLMIEFFTRKGKHLSTEKFSF